MIAATQYSFTIAFFSFISETICSIIDFQQEKLLIAVLMTVGMTGLAWVRDITKFSFAFLVGVLCLAFTWLTVMFFTVKQLKEQGGISPNIQPISNNYPIMISFSIYSFEGIGIVMPIMQTTAVPERFGTILIAAITTLIVMYLIFSMTTYLTFGDQTGQFITENMP